MKTGSIKGDKRNLLGLLLIFVVGAVVMLSKHIKKELIPVIQIHNTTVDTWMNLSAHEISEIKLYSLIEPCKGTKTINKPIVVTDQSKVISIVKGLQSRKNRSEFLNDSWLEHWNISRYIWLEVFCKNSLRFSFRVSWHDRGDVCDFGIKWSSLYDKHIANDVFEVGASAELAETLNALVDSNLVHWVSCYDQDWDMSSTNGPVFIGVQP